MSSDLFMVGGNEHVHPAMQLAFMVALVLYIIHTVWTLVLMAKKQSFSQKEGLLYWGASTISVRDDYGSPNTGSLSERSDRVVASAYQDATGNVHTSMAAVVPVASAPVAPVATFVSARENMVKGKKTPEQELMERQQHH